MLAKKNQLCCFKLMCLEQREQIVLPHSVRSSPSDQYIPLIPLPLPENHNKSFFSTSSMTHFRGGKPVSVYVCCCHVSCWCIIRYGFLLASGVPGDGRGQHHSGSKLAHPSALHTGTNTPLNQGLHILL